MSEIEPRKPNRGGKSGQSPDPYLRAFLRQAVAIVAAERGFNETSQAKLQQLATQLGLGDDTFREAVEKLKQPNNSFGLKRYEKTFVEYLVNQFDRMQGDVLNIRSEKTLVDLAARKYQIESVRAHQLIQMTAEQNDVATISHVDAEQYARQLIEDAVGDATELAAPDKAKLVQACVNWGLSDVAANQLLNRLFRKNSSRRSRRLTLQICSLIFSIAVIGGSAWAVYKVDWEKLLANNATTPNRNSTVADNLEVPLPDWWDDRLVDARSILAERKDRLLNSVTSIADPDASDLPSTYRQLAEVALDGRKTDAALEKCVGLIYVMDPVDRNVEPIKNLLDEALKINDDTQPMLPSRLRRAQRAVHCLGTMLVNCIENPRSIAPRRFEKLNELHQQVFGRSFTGSSLNEYLAVTEPVVALEQWSHALKFSNSHPKLVAGLLPELEKLAASSQPEFNEIRTQAAQSITNLAPIQWSTIRDSIAVSIEQGSSADVASWCEIIQATNDQSLSRFLADRLGVKLNIDRGLSRDETLKRLQDFRMQNSFPNYEIAKVASGQLDSVLSELRDAIVMADVSWKDKEIRLHSDSDTLKVLGKVAHSNNLLLAWIQGYEQKQSFDHFERVFSNSDLPSLRFDIAPMRQPPTPSQKRQLESAFDRLFNSETNQISARMSSLNVIRDVADFLADLDYKTSKSFAEYLFRDKEARESLAVDRALVDLKHWDNLKLAIADYIDDSTEQLDTVLDILSRLGLDDIELAGGDWNKLVQKAVLEQSARSLADRNQQRFEQVWQPVQVALRVKLEERVRVLSAGQVRLSRAPFPDNWVEDLQHCLEFDSGRAGNPFAKQMFDRQLGLIMENQSRFQRLSEATELLARKYEDDYRSLLSDQQTDTPKILVESESENGLLVSAQKVLIAELQLHHVLTRARQAILAGWN